MQGTTELIWFTFLTRRFVAFMPWHKCHKRPTCPKRACRSSISPRTPVGAGSRAHQRVQRSERYNMSNTVLGRPMSPNKGIGWMDSSSSSSSVYILVVLMFNIPISILTKYIEQSIILYSVLMFSLGLIINELTNFQIAGVLILI